MRFGFKRGRAYSLSSRFGLPGNRARRSETAECGAGLRAGAMVGDRGDGRCYWSVGRGCTGSKGRTQMLRNCTGLP
jgi:hypothetical protein